MPTKADLVHVNFSRIPVPIAPTVEDEALQDWVQEVTNYLRHIERSSTGLKMLQKLTEENVPDRTRNYFLMYDESQGEIVFIEDTQ